MNSHENAESPLLVFRASAFWTMNLFGAAVGGFIGSLLIIIWTSSHGDAPGVGLSWLLGASYVVALMAYFPGNLSVLWPYAVELDPSYGLTLFGPLKRVTVRLSEIGDIEDSLFWQGSVVHLTKPRAALTQFVIPWYFGSQRTAMIEAIRAATRQADVA